MIKNIYVIFKERYEYAVTHTVYWSEKIEGPFLPEEAKELVENLREAKRLGNVKDIIVLNYLGVEKDL